MRPVFISESDLYDLSRSNEQLAQDIGVSRMSVWRRRVDAGLHTPTRKGIDEDTVAVLAKRGKNDVEIAAVLGCTAQGVNKVRKRLGLKSLPRGRRAAG